MFGAFKIQKYIDISIYDFYWFICEYWPASVPNNMNPSLTHSLYSKIYADLIDGFYWFICAYWPASVPNNINPSLTDSLCSKIYANLIRDFSRITGTSIHMNKYFTFNISIFSLVLCIFLVVFTFLWSVHYIDINNQLLQKKYTGLK